MLFVVCIFVFGGLLYVEVCREIIYDDTKGKNLKVIMMQTLADLCGRLY